MALNRLKILTLLAAFVASPSTLAAEAGSAAPPTPKLVVVISVDQFSANLFDQYRGRFTQGLRTLTEGVVFPSGYQSHAATETCPGHSTLLTGRHPYATGIIANNWYDRTTGKNLYCVADAAHPVAGRPGQGRGPANLKLSTLGEWMKRANLASRVFGVSGKDRAAIMMTGHDPDGVFWWDDEKGFTTSVPEGATPEARLAPVAGLNRALFLRWRQTPPRWKPLDGRCAALDGQHNYGAITVDHKTPPPVPAIARGGNPVADKAFAKWFRASPELDRVTLDLAQSLIARFGLGRGNAPDLLAVSLSATDYIGHSYGNQGPEMCDQMAQLDRMLGMFLKRIEALHVPAIVVLTADHGAVDAAERVAERAIPAARMNVRDLVKEINAGVRARLGLASDPLTGDPDQLYLTAAGIAQRKRVIEAALDLLRQRPGVAAAYSADEIAAAPRPAPGTPPDELTLIQRLAESFAPLRSGDIAVVYPPYASTYAPRKPGDAIAGHGSPWNYDRRVPILFWWPGASGFEQPLPVEAVDIAPTLAALLHIPAPAVDGRCLDLDRGAPDGCRPDPN